ncbi:Crp/Fnr family transcriptional regulator [Bacillus shivajii]|uniref:Crp/Fnr family transcriptional regulator n=1 Tax=Bacillus shivajii TaxID=1983719 RepID=UPI001CF9FFCE|nr:Crp/Fnr family transcriptional regulator [Bacillus shivajii]UCZ52049.1 Crp/Fnr family transcriptional regulator [Bacillus shivajii]
MVRSMQHTNESTFFGSLSNIGKTLLRSIGTPIEAEKGSYLFNEGDKPKHIYLVETGKVRLSKTYTDGKTFFLQLKKKDDVIGELSLYNMLIHQYNAEVVQEARLLRFRREEVEQLFMKHTELATKYMKWLSTENQTLLAQFRCLVFCGKEGAVFSVLIRLSNEYGKDVDNGVLINRKITNQEIANYVGTTRESINRILKRLMKNHILSVNTKYITIHSMDYLKQHLRCSHCPFEECRI